MKPENIMLNRERCEEASRQVKYCKNCGRPESEHIPTSFGGRIWNNWCPEPGHNWGGVKTVWREV
jgi:hypothetical protein